MPNQDHQIVPNPVPDCAALKKFGRWWWFCDAEIMSERQPVLVNVLDKYNPESPLKFEHPWGSMSKRPVDDFPGASPHMRSVATFTDCFLGPCR